MKSQALKPALWMTYFILLSLATSLVLLLSLFYYYGYSINSVIQLEFLNINIDGEVEKWMINTKIALLVVGNLIGIFVFWKVREVLLNIPEIGPFDHKIIKTIRLIMTGTILLILFNAISSFVFDIILGEFRIVLDTSTLVIIFLIFLIYLLIEIFKHGAMIQEEQKLTI